MAAIPPAPPLPFEYIQKSSVKIDADSISPEENEETGNFICDFTNFNRKLITQIKPISQSGPNCGIAALAMVSSLTPGSLTVDQIFTIAKSRGFTINGEMFSVLNMKFLAESVVSPWYEVEMFSDGLLVNETRIVESLFRRDLMLIPYDSDKNHSPCCKEGHKAHWALVCGVLTDILGQVSVAVRHGKSRHMAVWPLHQLRLSNDNLVSFDPERASDGYTYILPEGGVKAGLASKFILLHRRDACNNS